MGGRASWPRRRSTFGVLPGRGAGPAGASWPADCSNRGLPGPELALRGGFAANAGRGIVPLVELDGVTVVPERATSALAEAFWP